MTHAQKVRHRLGDGRQALVETQHLWGHQATKKPRGSAISEPGIWCGVVCHLLPCKPCLRNCGGGSLARSSDMISDTEMQFSSPKVDLHRHGKRRGGGEPCILTIHARHGRCRRSPSCRPAIQTSLPSCRVELSSHSTANTFTACACCACDLACLHLLVCPLSVAVSGSCSAGMWYRRAMGLRHILPTCPSPPDRLSPLK